MRISRGLSAALVAGCTLMASPSFADDAASVDSQATVLADADLAVSDTPHFVAEVPLPPTRSQASIIVRQKAGLRPAATPRIVLASARVPVSGGLVSTVPAREVVRPASFWLTVGTGF